MTPRLLKAARALLLAQGVALHPETLAEEFAELEAATLEAETPTEDLAWLDARLRGTRRPLTTKELALALAADKSLTYSAAKKRLYRLIPVTLEAKQDGPAFVHGGKTVKCWQWHPRF